MRVVIGVLGAIVLAATAFGGASVAAGTWGADEPVLAPVDGVANPRVEVGPGGYAVVLIPKASTSTRADLFSKPAARGLEIAVRPAIGQRFGEPITLDERRPASYGFGMSATGESVIAWVDRRSRLLVTRFSPGERPPTPSRLASGIDGQIALSVADDGTAILLYDDGEKPRILGRTALPGGSFGRSELVARGVTTGSVVLDAGDAGRGVIAWSRGRREVLASQRTGTGFQAPQVLPSGDQPVGLLTALATPTESFVAIDGKLRVCVAPSGGSFGPAESLLTSQRSKGYHVALDADSTGNATIVWELVAGSKPAGIDFTTRSAGGAFGAVESLTDRPAGLDVDLDVAPNGAAVSTWNDLSRFSTTIRGVLRQPGGGFGKVVRVGNLERRAAILPSDTAIGPDGDVVNVLRGTGRRGRGVYASSVPVGP